MRLRLPVLSVFAVLVSISTPALAQAPSGGRDITEAPLSPEYARELRSIAGQLDREPIIVPLVLVAHVGSIESPWSIVVLRRALHSEHRWTIGLALAELAHHNALDLAQYGGVGLAMRLEELTTRGPEMSRQRAGLLLSVIRKRLPHLIRQGPDGRHRVAADVFPRGRELPDPPAPPGSGGSGDERRGGGKTIVEKPEDTLLARRLLGAESAAKGLDLVWAIDCTGSMTRQLAGVLEGTTRVSSVLAELLGETRLGLIAYRDRVEGRRTLSGDADRFANDLRRLQADRGGSPAERVDIAFAAARQARMGWRRDGACAVVFIGDAGPETRRAEELFRVVKATRNSWKTLRVHCVKVGLAGFEIAPASSFWDTLAEQGGGSCVPFAPDRDLAEGLCRSAWPQLDEPILARIFEVIWSTGGWAPLAVPAPEGRGDVAGIGEPSWRAPSGAHG